MKKLKVINKIMIHLTRSEFADMHYMHTLFDGNALKVFRWS